LPLGARAPRPLPASPPKGWYSRGYLPHLDAPNLIQAITFRLADSLPSDVLERLTDDPDRRRKLEALLDAGQGACLLRKQRAAEITQDVLLACDGEQYRLISWVIMPNHVHCLLETKSDWPLCRVVQSWKSVSAHRINRLLGRSGALWQPDYFDRYIRDDHHLAAAIAYIEDNPVKAGLASVAEDWPWGSAAMRAGRPRSQESIMP